MRTLTFYDKGQEAGLDTDGLLRFEVNYKKRLQYQVEWSVFLSDLHDPERYSYMVQKWKQEYDAIKKIKRHTLQRPNKTAELKYQLLGLGIESLGGFSVVSDQIKAWNLPRDKERRCRDLIRRANRRGNSEEDQDLLKELDTAMNEAVTHALTF